MDDTDVKTHTHMHHTDVTMHTHMHDRDVMMHTHMDDRDVMMHTHMDDRDVMMQTHMHDRDVTMHTHMHTNVHDTDVQCCEHRTKKMQLVQCTTQTLVCQQVTFQEVVCQQEPLLGGGGTHRKVYVINCKWSLKRFSTPFVSAPPHERCLFGQQIRFVSTLGTPEMLGCFAAKTWWSGLPIDA